MFNRNAIDTPHMEKIDKIFKDAGKKARKMANGDWSIPFSVAMVMKKVKVFDPIKCELEVALTMIQRYKLTGLPDDIRPLVQEFILDPTKFKCRVNEEEDYLVNDSSRSIPKAPNLTFSKEVAKSD